MTRTGRGTAMAALLTGLAVLASLPAPCACPPEPPAADHSCCEPPLGYQLAQADCCAVSELASEAPAALSPLATVAAPDAVDGPWLSVAIPTAAPRLVSSEPTFSPPSTVRRL